MIKTKTLETPLFGEFFELIVYDKVNELFKYMPDLSSLGDINGYDGFVLEHDHNKYIVFKRFIQRGKQYPTPGIIAHEAKHLTNNIFISIGQKLDAWNDEVECYLLQWIVDEVHGFLAEIVKMENNKKRGKILNDNILVQ